MAAALTHTCRCGETRMEIAVPAPSAGTHLRCYCRDCQTAARLNDPDQDRLSPAGATDVWHTTPDRLVLLTGAERLHICRLSPRGAFRWYAGCCGSLMLSTTKTLRLPFVSVPLAQPRLAESAALIGPVRCHGFVRSARPGAGAPDAPSGSWYAVAMAVRRGIAACLTGRIRRNPLRQPDGSPIAPVEVISLARRKASLPEHLR